MNETEKTVAQDQQELTIGHDLHSLWVMAIRSRSKPIRILSTASSIAANGSEQPLNAIVITHSQGATVVRSIRVTTIGSSRPARPQMECTPKEASAVIYPEHRMGRQLDCQIAWTLVSHHLQCIGVPGQRQHEDPSYS